MSDRAIALANLKRLVEEQSEDHGLWFDAVYITEAYLQQALRALHAAAEDVIEAKP